MAVPYGALMTECHVLCSLTVFSLRGSGLPTFAGSILLNIQAQTLNVRKYHNESSTAQAILMLTNLTLFLFMF